MIIKSNAEDFYVEEILDAQPQVSGDYALYILEKKDENTLRVIDILSQKMKIPVSSFGYGGRKDKHAHTKQYISIKTNKAQENIDSTKWSIRKTGYLDRPMGPDLIACNSFRIIARNIENDGIEELKRILGSLKTEGFVNYFDDQRFGTFDPLQGFLAQKVIRGHFNGALKIYITHPSSEDDKKEKERKKKIYDNWGDWKVCSQFARNPYELSAFDRLALKKNDFVNMLRQIPSHEMTLFFSAYQAHLWNEVARRFFKEKTAAMVKTGGIDGDYFFYNEISKEESGYFKRLSIPTAASKMEFNDKAIRVLYENVFSEEEIRPPQFNITKIRQAYFKSIQRPLVALPESLSFEAALDENYQGKQKITLNFKLQRGSYATMLLKRLIAK